MSWLLLIIAGCLEIAWAVGLKYTEGFTRLWPTLLTVLVMAVSIGLLGLAMRSLPISTAYPVWMGIGAVGTVILGAFLFGEPIPLIKAVSIALILLGVVGLKVSG